MKKKDGIDDAVVELYITGKDKTAVMYYDVITGKDKMAVMYYDVRSKYEITLTRLYGIQ